MIGIKNTVQDAGSAVIIRRNGRSILKDMKARVSRTATLDLGTVIDNQGYAVGDRTLRILQRVSESDEVKILDLHKNNLFLWISTSEGLFYGAVERLKIDRGQMDMTFLVKE